MFFFFFRFNLVTGEPECDALSAIINLSGSFAVGVSHLSDLFVRRADSDLRSSLRGPAAATFGTLWNLVLCPSFIAWSQKCSPSRQVFGRTQNPGECVRAHTRMQPTLTFIESVREKRTNRYDQASLSSRCLALPGPGDTRTVITSRHFPGLKIWL